MTKKLKLRKKTSDQFELKHRINLFQIECFMTKDFFSETVEKTQEKFDLVPQRQLL